MNLHPALKLLLALGLAGCQPVPKRFEDVVTKTPQPQSQSVSAQAQNSPESLWGNQVEVTGKVIDVLDQGVYRINLGGIYGFTNLFVIDKTGTNVVLRSGDKLKAAGVLDTYPARHSHSANKDRHWAAMNSKMESQPIVHAERIWAFWGSQAPSTQRATLTFLSPQEFENHAQSNPRPDCEVLFRTPNAVGNPCALPEDPSTALPAE